MSEITRARSSYIRSVVAERATRSRVIFWRKKGKRASRLRRLLARQRADRVAKGKYYEKLKAANTPRNRAVKHATRMLGAKEVPAGSNKGPQVTSWQKSFGDWLVGQPWCGVYIGVALRHAGVNVNSRIAAVSFIEDDARAKRNGFKEWKTIKTSGRSGDVAVLFGRGVHAGLILRRDKKLGGYWIAEGNTSPGAGGSQSNGGGSYKRFRPYSAIHGIAVPDYKGE